MNAERPEPKAPLRRVPADRLNRVVAAIFVQAGMSEPDAQTVAEALVWANLRDVPSHGVSRVERYLDFIRRGDLDPKAVPEIRSITHAAFVCQANRAAGPIAFTFAAREASRRCVQSGIAFGLIRGTTHTGAIGRYVDMLAADGRSGIAANAGPANMAYFGASAAGVSTSPFAMAVPGHACAPVLDFSTAAIAMGKLRGMADRQETLAPGLALDAHGQPTQNPAMAKTSMPLAGAVGSGLAFMFECLTSILAGEPIIAPVLAARTKGRHVQNAFILAIDVAQFRPLDDFKDDLREFMTQIELLPRQSGVATLLAPGERGARAATRNREAGIPLSDKTLKMLENLSGRAIDWSAGR
ncbi:MAG TPA: Ldh family oxidoreductase [Stellaceae bacterium]|nr:Ldh family oxidoreductase [Stellaceae bacterium]